MPEKLEKTLSLRSLIGTGYDRFWRFQGRYRVVKGGRGSKKSVTTAYWYIIHLMKHSGANLLVVRRAFNTLRDSCYTLLEWVIHQLGVAHLWRCTTSPLQMEYKPTGQKIYFRGLDDPLKITSITVKTGNLCWLWIEEAYEIESEDKFNTLEESFRGQVDEGIFKQITLTFNPWSEKHWIKARFFDKADPQIFATTTNYLCNEWLTEADLQMYETMKENNPRRYEVAGLGNWGMEGGTIFELEWLNGRYRQLPEHCTLIQTWDLPFKNSESSAKCAGIILAKKGGEFFIVDCINEKMDFVTSASAIKNMTAKHPTARAKVIEDKANGPAIISYLKKDISGMVSFNPKGSKEDRALSITPYFQAGNVYFPEGASWVADLVTDLATFPKGQYKDTVDALVQGFLYLTEKPEQKLVNQNKLTQRSYWK